MLPIKEIITPALAKLYLTSNNNNRSLNKNLIKRYADAMVRGEWKMNGDSIRFSISGRLLDGQHRMSAIIESKRPIELLVIRGLAEDVFDTIDQGRKRRMADVLHIQGFKNNVELGSLLSLIYYHQLGDIGKMKSQYIFPFPTPQQLLCVLQKDEKAIEYSKKFFLKLRCNSRLVPSSICMYMHYVLVKKGYEKEAGVFLLHLIKGANLEDESPILWVRNYFIKLKGDGFRIDKIYAAALMIKAWNAYIQNKKIKNITHKMKDNFPKIYTPERDLLSPKI